MITEKMREVNLHGMNRVSSYEKLADIMLALMKEGFTGYLQINFVKGTIANLNRHEKLEIT